MCVSLQAHDASQRCALYAMTKTRRNFAVNTALKWSDEWVANTLEKWALIQKRLRTPHLAIMKIIKKEKKKKKYHINGCVFNM